MAGSIQLEAEWNGLVLRTLHSVGEFRQVAALQKDVWGFEDAELVPARIFLVGEKIGGCVIGAWEGSKLIGFFFALPAVRERESYLHAHMLAVSAEKRNLGLGARLMWMGREWAQTAGIERIEWTFDPLEIKNSYLYLERLGAIARRYVVNQYGITSSPLQGGLPTDRLIAEWQIESERVRECARGAKNAAPAIVEEVEVPAGVYEWKAQPEMRTRAAEALRGVREQLLRAFASGLQAVGYERTGDGGGKFLLANG